MIFLGRTSVFASGVGALVLALGGCAHDDAGYADEATQSADDDEASDSLAASEAYARAAGCDAGRRLPFPWGWLFPRRDGGACTPDGSLPPSDAGTPSDAGMPSDDTAGRTLVPHPSWTCGMPDGIPPPALGKPAFEAVFEVAADYDLGTTQFGDRHVLAFGKGTFTGESLSATLLPGSFELPLSLANGALETEQVLTAKSADGSAFYMRVCGVAGGPNGIPRVVFDIEAPNGSRYAALHTRKLVGTRERSSDGKQITLRVFDVTDVALPAERVEVAEPSGVEDQTWECRTGGGEAGAEVYRETVGLGGWVTVGESKRGLRNIIPITGGKTSGRIVGSVLALGADYQIFAPNGFDLDARYVLKTNDGEYVIVRNCGLADKLVPVFEARSSGPYAWVNRNQWVSSAPGVGLGTVSLTIFERR